MSLRIPALVATVILGCVALAGCDDEPEAAEDPQAVVTTDAGCAALVPDGVFTALGWTAQGGATYTVRGCRREAEQGYVEVRRRTGKATGAEKARRVYDDLCAVLDRTGGASPGRPAPWLGEDVTACAVEPARDVGLTKLVVLVGKHEVLQFGVAALTATPHPRVRAALRQLLAAATA